MGKAWRGCLAAMAAGATLMTAACGGHSSATGRGHTTSTTAALNSAASELLKLLDTGNKGTWHAHYLVNIGGSASGSTTEVEVWRRPPELRQDLTQMVGSSVVAKSEEFLLKNSAVSCSQQAGTGPWLCTPSNTSATSSGGILNQASSQLKGVSVVETSDVLKGVPAKCFQGTIAGGPTKLCLTSDGIPVLYVNGSAQLQLQSYDHAVPDSVFTPPAPVSGSKQG